MRLVPRAYWRFLVSRFHGQIEYALREYLNRSRDLTDFSFEVPPDGLPFEAFSPLFSSTLLDHSIISYTVREAAYLFSILRREKPKIAVEIGRYKGGGTLLMAAAMDGGELWSIDSGEKMDRLYGKSIRLGNETALFFLMQNIKTILHLRTGDSRTIEIPTGEIDLLLIDGDHSYEGVKSDIERFGVRVKSGGSILFDDFNKAGVIRAMDALLPEAWHFERLVDGRMAHLRRI